MTNYNDLGKTALIYYLGGVIFVIIFWVLVLDVPTAAIVAALALIPIAGMVVGVLIKLSFSHEAHDDSHNPDEEKH